MPIFSRNRNGKFIDISYLVALDQPRIHYLRETIKEQNKPEALRAPNMNPQDPVTLRDELRALEHKHHGSFKVPSLDELKLAALKVFETELKRLLDNPPIDKKQAKKLLEIRQSIINAKLPQFQNDIDPHKQIFDIIRNEYSSSKGQFEKDLTHFAQRNFHCTLSKSGWMKSVSVQFHPTNEGEFFRLLSLNPEDATPTERARRKEIVSSLTYRNGYQPNQVWADALSKVKAAMKPDIGELLLAREKLTQPVTHFNSPLYISCLKRWIAQEGQGKKPMQKAILEQLGNLVVSISDNSSLDDLDSKRNELTGLVSRAEHEKNPMRGESTTLSLVHDVLNACDQERDSVTRSKLYTEHDLDMVNDILARYLPQQPKLGIPDSGPDEKAEPLSTNFGADQNDGGGIGLQGGANSSEPSERIKITPDLDEQKYDAVTVSANQNLSEAGPQIGESPPEPSVAAATPPEQKNAPVHAAANRNSFYKPGEEAHRGKMSDVNKQLMERFKKQDQDPPAESNAPKPPI